MADKHYETTPLDGWLILLVFMPVQLFIGGLVICKLWAWFAVPALHVPAISLGQAMGLGIMVATLVSSPASTRKPMPWWELTLASACLDGISLLAGYIVHASIT